MVEIFRSTVRWSGFQGAPGYSVLHSGVFMDEGQGVQNVTNAVRALFVSLAAELPGAVDLDILPEVEIIEHTTNTLVDVQPVDGGATISGGSTGTYSAPTGAVINWRTNTLRNGRRLRGRNFIVPLGGAAYASDGTLDTPARLVLQTAVDNYLADPGITPIIYGRPTAGGTDGIEGVVVSGTVPDVAAVLRSRRD